METFKGRIVLKPISQRDYSKVSLGSLTVFSHEEAWSGTVAKIENGFVYTTDGDEIPLEDARKFMVECSDKKNMLSLSENNINEAIDNDWWDYYHDAKELDFYYDGSCARVVVMPVELSETERGFSVGEFVDQYGAKCSIQASSIVTKACIWIGVDDANPQIMVRDAIRLGLRERLGDAADCGWCDYELPKEVHMSTRMHLSREDVKKILPLLTKFAETGSL